MYFAARGLKVTGVDFVEQAIELAKLRAAQQGVEVEFLIKDATTYASWDRTFSATIDSGLYHIYPAADRERYVAGLRHILDESGHLFLFSFADCSSAPAAAFPVTKLKAILPMVG